MGVGGRKSVVYLHDNQIKYKRCGNVWWIGLDVVLRAEQLYICKQEYVDIWFFGDFGKDGLIGRNDIYKHAFCYKWIFRRKI